MKKTLIIAGCVLISACGLKAINVKPNQVGDYWAPNNKYSTVVRSKELGCGLFLPGDDGTKPSGLVTYTITDNGGTKDVKVTDLKNGMTKEDVSLWESMMNLGGFKQYDAVVQPAQPVIVQQRFSFQPSEKHCNK